MDLWSISVIESISSLLLTALGSEPVQCLYSHVYNVLCSGSWSCSRTETWISWSWSGGPEKAHVTSTLLWALRKVPAPWTSTVLLVCSLCLQPVLCCPALLPLWRPGGHGGRDPEFPLRRWESHGNFMRMVRGWAQMTCKKKSQFSHLNIRSTLFKVAFKNLSVTRLNSILVA